MDLEQQVQQAERARYALEYLAPKFDEIEKGLMEALLETNMHDQASRDELTRSMKNLRRLRDCINTDLANGDYAKRLLRDLEQRNRIREWFRG